MATLTMMRYATRRVASSIFAGRALHSSPPTQEHYINATKADFDRIALGGPPDRVVLVDFHAGWCQPCHQLSPILRKLTDPATGIKSGSDCALDLVTIDIEDEDNGGFALSQSHKVRALPTVVAYRGGQPVDEFVGALNEPGVVAFLNKV